LLVQTPGDLLRLRGVLPPVIAQLVGTAPNDDDGTEARNRPRGLDRGHGDTDASYLRRLQRPNDAAYGQPAQNLDARLLLRELRTQALETLDLRVLGRRRDSFVAHVDEPAHLSLVHMWDEWHRGVGLGAERLQHPSAIVTCPPKWLGGSLQRRSP
jgi:hypothetical protein